MKLHDSSREEEFHLVQDILAGSEAAWHAFIDRYSAVIYRVAHAYLFSPEEVRSAYVEILESLYKSKFSQFPSGTPLVPWLTAVSRRMIVDILRRKLGRSTRPRGLCRLSRKDQEVFRLYYVNGHPFAEVVAYLRARYPSFAEEDLVGCLRRIEDRISSRTLRRIAYDLHAQSVGAASGRLLRYFEAVTEDMRRRGQEASPEFLFLQKESEAVLDGVRARLNDLPERQRRVLLLRFDRGLTARQISDEMGLPSPRRAYTLIDQALRALASMLPDAPGTAIAKAPGRGTGHVS